MTLHVRLSHILQRHRSEQIGSNRKRRLLYVLQVIATVIADLHAERSRFVSQISREPSMEMLLPWRRPRSADLERGQPGPPLNPITGTFGLRGRDARQGLRCAVLPLGPPLARTRAGRIVAVAGGRGARAARR